MPQGGWRAVLAAGALVAVEYPAGEKQVVIGRVDGFKASAVLNQRFLGRWRGCRVRWQPAFRDAEGVEVPGKEALVGSSPVIERMAYAQLIMGGGHVRKGAYLGPPYEA